MHTLLPPRHRLSRGCVILGPHTMLAWPGAVRERDRQMTGFLAQLNILLPARRLLPR